MIPELKHSQRSLVLFDFDGTITQKDTLFEIIKYDKGIFSFFLGILILSPSFLSYSLKKINAQKLKERFLSYFLKSRPFNNWNNVCLNYSRNGLPKIIRPKALQKINEHKQKNDRIIVVTASIENWVKPWCDEQEIECIGSRIEIINDRITGKLIGKNCNGMEKSRRIQEYLKLETYSSIYAYGDTKGDIEMLKLANFPFYKIF